MTPTARPEGSCAAAPPPRPPSTSATRPALHPQQRRGINAPSSARNSDECTLRFVIIFAILINDEKSPALTMDTGTREMVYRQLRLN